ncbi:hypothetical protein [Streptomyces sp. NPDC088246]|uniref:hypothetical protein n=1 Tax=Streptomyces sp. NPDC088246 TaxID=3365842 RepID=UPI0038033494
MRTRLELVPEGAWEPAGFSEVGWLERQSRERERATRGPRSYGGGARRLLRAASGGGVPRGRRGAGGALQW